MTEQASTYVFGRFVGAHHLEAAVLNTLWKWLPTYQHEVAREAGLAPLHMQAIRSWRVSSDMGRMPEDQLPSVILVNDGVAELPVKHDGGLYIATWEVVLGVQVAAKGEKVKAAPRALTLARMYALAIRLCLIQKRDEDGIMGMVDWITERPGAVLVSEDDRTTCLATNVFHIVVDGAAEWTEGPLDPIYPPEDPDAPPPDRPEWPIALTYDLEVIKVPLLEPLSPAPPASPFSQAFTGAFDA